MVDFWLISADEWTRKSNGFETIQITLITQFAEKLKFCNHGGNWFRGTRNLKDLDQTSQHDGG